MFHVNRSAEPVAAPRNQEGSKRCDVCDKSYSCQRELNRHKKTVHTDGRLERGRHKCPAQGCRFGRLGFARKDKLLRHWGWMHEDLGRIDAARPWCNTAGGYGAGRSESLSSSKRKRKTARRGRSQVDVHIELISDEIACSR